VTTAYENTKAWRKRHPDIKAYRAEESRKWRAAHPELAQEIQDRHKAKVGHDRIRQLNTEAARRRRATPKYKAQQAIRNRRSKEKQEAQRITLAGRPRPTICELCNEDPRFSNPTFGNHKILFDHCHVKGHFRGWICDRCNKVLGLVRDNHELLLRMAAYLKGTNNGSSHNRPTKETA
jgi:hypothetical protein